MPWSELALVGSTPTKNTNMSQLYGRLSLVEDVYPNKNRGMNYGIYRLLPIMKTSSIFIMVILLLFY